MLKKEKLNKRQRPDMLGEKNPNWKGDKVGYFALHNWIKRQFGKPNKCEKCGTTIAKRFEWANLSGKYMRSKKDWIRVCPKCHKKLDKNNYPPVWNKGTKGICKANSGSFTSERARQIQLNRWSKIKIYGK